MGFTWMFAFSASFSGVPALWYIYIIINSLQGLYVFFAFVFNHRIRRLWSHKLGLTCVEESGSSKKTKTTSLQKNGGYIKTKQSDESNKKKENPTDLNVAKKTILDSKEIESNENKIALLNENERNEPDSFAQTESNSKHAKEVGALDRIESTVSSV